jgi:hypothetical protein
MTTREAKPFNAAASEFKCIFCLLTSIYFTAKAFKQAVGVYTIKFKEGFLSGFMKAKRA